jgi:hypothetical protein
VVLVLLLKELKELIPVVHLARIRQAEVQGVHARIRQVEAQGVHVRIRQAEVPNQVVQDQEVAVLQDQEEVDVVEDNDRLNNGFLKVFLNDYFLEKYVEK